MMDTTLQWSSYKDQFGGTTTQIMPMLRGSYRFKERFTFDADGGFQKDRLQRPSEQYQNHPPLLFCRTALGFLKQTNFVHIGRR